MFIYQHVGGKITIGELTTDQATALQIAVLAISENQVEQTDESRFLRRVAMQLDEILNQRSCYAIQPHHDNA